MSKKSDDSVERFFRKAVAQQDLSHRDSDWKNMEKMLDEQALAAGALKARTTKKIVTYSTIGILALFGLYVAILRPSTATTNSNNEISDNSSLKQQEAKPSQATAGMLGPLSGSKENPSADLLSSDSKSSGNFSNSNSKSSSVHNQLNVPKDLTTSPGSVKKSSPIEASSFEYELSEKAKTEIAGQVESDNDARLFLSELQPDGSAQKALMSTSTPEKSELQISEESLENDSVAENAIAEEAIKSEIDDVEDPRTKIPTRWSVALTVAPDFSSTNVGRYSTPGAAFGLLISYRPLSSWQISSGIIKSFKQYEGYGDEYQPPPGYWENRTNGVVPDEVAGNCGIVEWPVILRYDFIVKDKSRFYVTSGVSSYLMRSESYKYHFAQDNPGAASGWTASKPTSYAFSIGHLSAGFERTLSNRLAVAIEPYFKLPFKSIGWTNINLHSTGAYLSVRYTLQRKSKPPQPKPTGNDN